MKKGDIVRLKNQGERSLLYIITGTDILRPGVLTPEELAVLPLKFYRLISLDTILNSKHTKRLRYAFGDNLIKVDINEDL